MVQIGSVAGALIAFIFNDRIGRLWTTRELCSVWIVGTIIYLTANGSYGQVLGGRFVMGLGIGQTVVVAPAYDPCNSRLVVMLTDVATLPKSLLAVSEASRFVSSLALYILEPCSGTFRTMAQVFTSALAKLYNGKLRLCSTYTLLSLSWLLVSSLSKVLGG